MDTTCAAWRRVRYDLETGAIKQMMTDKYDNC